MKGKKNPIIACGSTAHDGSTARGSNKAYESRSGNSRIKTRILVFLIYV